ncbi:MAG: hypothetical protein ABTR07_15310 [Candidatus Competibacter denitrificans]
MKIIALLLISIALPSLAASVREHWGFAWDAYPQAALVDHFDLEICLPGQCLLTRINGGTTTTVRDIRIPPELPGNGQAVLRACTATGGCSGNSNAVFVDRTPPPAPTDGAWHRSIPQSESIPP